MQVLHKPGALDKHAAAPAGRVKHRALFRLQDIGNQRDQGDRREKLPAVMRLLVGKLREEIFINPSKNIAVNLFKFFRI